MEGSKKQNYSVDISELEENSSYDEKNVFSDSAVAERWKAVYDACEYEGAGHFDPEITWTKEEEKALVRSLDLRVFLMVFILFCALDLVRRNVTRAVSDNFLDDLKMNNTDYNLDKHYILLPFYVLSFQVIYFPKDLDVNMSFQPKWFPGQFCVFFKPS